MWHSWVWDAFPADSRYIDVLAEMLRQAIGQFCPTRAGVVNQKRQPIPPIFDEPVWFIVRTRRIKGGMRFCHPAAGHGFRR